MIEYNAGQFDAIMKSLHDVDSMKKFMLESNAIENEDYLNPKDLVVVKDVCKKGIKSLKHLKKIHITITSHLDVNWGGKWRTINVRVGSYKPPQWVEVPELMLRYWGNFENMNSWQAHNEFEHIHPFVDFNGRIGRLIWLSKAVREGYKFSIPFLQKYYYQTLDNTR